MRRKRAAARSKMPRPPIPPNLEAFPDAPPGAPVNLLFIHHSVGGQLLADPGPEEHSLDARRSLHRTHPNGGGLRKLLETQGYSVHEASYGSEIGHRTDLFDWLPKFRESMPRILATRWQDEMLASGCNQVVAFKSCYPNNAFKPGDGPGDAAGPELTLSNARATLTKLRDELARQPRTLFVYLTAPPLRDDSASEPAWKSLAKRALARPTLAEERRDAAAIAREFNDWVTSPGGWLAGYAQRNLVVFDYFDLLTDGTHFLQYASKGGTDNHPHSPAQREAARQFVSLLNRAVRYAGLA
jgi:hypothetical protein